MTALDSPTLLDSFFGLVAAIASFTHTPDHIAIGLIMWTVGVVLAIPFLLRNKLKTGNWFPKKKSAQPLPSWMSSPIYLWGSIAFWGCLMLAALWLQDYWSAGIFALIECLAILQLIKTKKISSPIPCAGTI